MKHHIIPLHEWRVRINPKITRYDKEFNAPDNVVHLTMEQHSQVHALLYELNHNKYDHIASQCIAGHINGEEAFRLACSVSATGRRVSDETRAKLSVAGRGRVVTEETKKKLSLNLTGVKKSKEHVEKMSRYQKEHPSRGMLGKTHSQETKALFSVQRKGLQKSLGRVLSQVTKDKIGAKHKGHTRNRGMKYSAQALANMAAAGERRRGQYTHSEETLQKMRKPHKRSPKVACPHCTTIGSGSGMIRYHFNNCKHKEKGVLAFS